VVIKLLGKQTLELDLAFQDSLKQSASFDQLMAIEGQIFKNAGCRKTLRFEVADKGYFIKIHSGVGWHEIVKNLVSFRLPVIGAQNEYDAIHKLAELNIDSLELIGFGRRGINPARQQSFVITKELENYISLAILSQNWANKPPVASVKRRLIRQVAGIARSLHENGINHRDLYLCHFLMKKQFNNDYSNAVLHVIDLHRVQIRSNTPRRWRIKDLAALHFSSMGIGLNRTDILRFIREYSTEKNLRSSLANDDLWKQVDRKAHLLNEKHQQL
jgi:heptose I phosphotransferase